MVLSSTMIYAKIDLSATKIETLQRQVYFDTVRERFNQQFNDKRVWMQYDWSNGEALLALIVVLVKTMVYIETIESQQ